MTICGGNTARFNKELRDDVALQATGWFVPAKRRGMNHPYETVRLLLTRSEWKEGI